jgi:hypothetical protein
VSAQEGRERSGQKGQKEAQQLPEVHGRGAEQGVKRIAHEQQAVLQLARRGPRPAFLAKSKGSDSN